MFNKYISFRDLILKTQHPSPHPTKWPGFEDHCCIPQSHKCLLLSSPSARSAAQGLRKPERNQGQDLQVGLPLIHTQRWEVPLPLRPSWWTLRKLERICSSINSPTPLAPRHHPFETGKTVKTRLSLKMRIEDTYSPELLGVDNSRGPEFSLL